MFMVMKGEGFSLALLSWINFLTNVSCRFSQDIATMTGYKPGLYWQLTWRFLAPIIMVAILISSVVSMFLKNPTYSAWNATLVRKSSTFFKPSLELMSLMLHQGTTVPTNYPDWVLAIGLVIIFLGIVPIPLVYLLRRFQCVKLDVDIHQGSIRRIETTVSTKEMIADVDVSSLPRYITLILGLRKCNNKADKTWLSLDIYVGAKLNKRIVKSS